MDRVTQETSVGQRLARAGSVIFSNRQHMKPPVNRDDCYAATHPSEHNSVFVIGRSERKRELRQGEWEKWRKEEGEKIRNGSTVGKHSERYLRGRDHEFAFLSPVKKSHGYGCPHVQKSYASACAVVRTLPAFHSPCLANTNLGCVWMCST